MCGYVRMSIDKLQGIRGDLVRTDDNWREWGFPKFVEALRKWTERNPIPAERESPEKLPDRKEPPLPREDTREKRSAHACLPCFRQEFASASPYQNYTRYQNKLDSGREIQKRKLHTQKMSLEFHEHKVYLLL